MVNDSEPRERKGVALMPRKPIPVATRLWPKVVWQSNGCWYWTGSKADGGYGVICVNGVQRLVHRVAYELVKGPIPKGMEIDHLCRNRICCHPSHLEVVTRAENIKRANEARTTCSRGHLINELNMYYTLSGLRRCRKCRCIRNKDKRERLKGVK